MTTYSTSRMRGPDATQWTIHKQTIINLYTHHSLKRLQEIMIETYNFQASKRMYDRKLKDWRIRKNLSRLQKEELAKIISHTGTWSERGTSQTVQQISISPGDRAKVARYVKAKARRSSTLSPRSFPREFLGSPSLGSSSLIVEPPSCSADFSYNGYPFFMPQSSRTDRISGSVTEEDEMATIDSSSVGIPRSSSSESFQHIDFEAITFTPVTANAPTTDDVSSVLMDESEIHAFYRTISQSLAVDERTPQPELLFKSLRHFLTNSETVNPGQAMGCLVLESPPRVWRKLKQTIYLYKHNSPSLASSVLDCVGELAQKELSTPRSFGFCFLLNLFSTLSPMNTGSGVCPRVRHVLGYLFFLARRSLPATHPINIICHELQRGDNLREITERALLCMIETCSMPSHAAEFDPSDISVSKKAMAFEAERQLIKHLRRDHRLEAAVDRAERLLCKHQNQARSNCSLESTYDTTELEHSCPISIRNGGPIFRARQAAAELVKTYMKDQRPFSYPRAIRLCYLRLTGKDQPEVFLMVDPYDLSNDLPTTSIDDLLNFRDTNSIFAMEDLSKIHSALGEHTLALMWLEAALSLAEEVVEDEEDGSNTIIQHITEKLDRMRRGQTVTV